ncbi:iron-sulfur cluster repair di-iron protein [soil metagenome]
MKDLRTETLGFLVAEQPLRAAVFDQFGLDYCCGGKQTLQASCADNTVDPNLVLAKLSEIDAVSEDKENGENWLNASISELVDHIQHTHHAYLKLELPRLQTLVDKVSRVHGVKEPRLVQAASVFSNMRQEIEQHTMKEEMVVFPFLRTLDQRKELHKTPFDSVSNPLHCLESEHSDAGDALIKLRALTDNYTVPDYACSSWLALVSGLAKFDRDLRTHIHKENSILFPKAIEAECARAKIPCTH